MNPNAHSADFARFFTTHFTKLVERWSRAIGGFTADAEDLVQESMLSLAEKWGTIENPEGWMHTACKRAAVKSVKRRRHRLHGALPLEDSYAESLPAEPENRGAESDAYFLARELVAGPLEWKALNLHVAGYTAADIAHIVHADPGWRRRRTRCSPANVNKMLRQEKARLSRQICDRLTIPEEDSRARNLLIMGTICMLPTRQREVFILRMAGLEPTEIAYVTDISPANARMSLSLANKKLAVVLGMPIEDAKHVLERVDKDLYPLTKATLVGAAVAHILPPDHNPLDAFRESRFGALDDAVFEVCYCAAYEMGRTIMLGRLGSSGETPTETMRFFSDYITDAVTQDVGGIRQLMAALSPERQFEMVSAATKKLCLKV